MKQPFIAYNLTILWTMDQFLSSILKQRLKPRVHNYFPLKNSRSMLEFFGLKIPFLALVVIVLVFVTDRGWWTPYIGATYMYFNSKLNISRIKNMSGRGRYRYYKWISTRRVELRYGRDSRGDTEWDKGKVRKMVKNQK